MTDRTSFNLKRIGIFIGSLGIGSATGLAAYKLFKTSTEMSVLVKALRVIAGSLLSLIVIGWVIVLILSCIVKYEDYLACDYDYSLGEDDDFDQYC